MNTFVVAFVSGVMGSLATISVSTIRDGALPGSQESMLVSLTREMVGKQDEMLAHQQFLRMNIIEMVEAQQAMLHEEKKSAATVDMESRRAMDFFRRNMGVDGEGP